MNLLVVDQLALLTKMPLPIKPSNVGILVKSANIVNIHAVTTKPNIDFEKLDLSDFLDLIEILIKEIISNNRRRINKKRKLFTKKQL